MDLKPKGGSHLGKKMWTFVHTLLPYSTITIVSRLLKITRRAHILIETET